MNHRFIIQAKTNTGISLYWNGKTWSASEDSAKKYTKTRKQVEAIANKIKYKFYPIGGHFDSRPTVEEVIKAQAI